jgi:hypothetical protein
MKSAIKASLIVAAAAAVSISGTIARADSTSTTTTTSSGSYITAPVRFVGKAFNAPFRVFRSGTWTPEIASTTTTTTFINNATVGPGPGIVVTNTVGEQLLVPSIMNANPTMFVTTGAQVTGFNIYLPNDLITRRDDLIARIYAEKANGKLSDSQASALLAEVQTVAHRSCGSMTDRGSSHAKQVQSMYRDFDKVSNDIFSNSHQGNKQLAGQYSFIVL